MSDTDAVRDIEGLSFEEAIEELEQIVRRLESEKVDLDGAISAYERGTRLRNHCAEKLRQAEEKVSKIRVDAEGRVSAEAANLADEIPF